MDDQYRTLARPSEGLYKEKGSKFIAYAYPVTSIEQIESHLADLRKQYYDARHVCYGYRLGIDGKPARANDDGEPANSAGMPILNELRSQEISDAFVAVIRYFGGIKLGVGGLIRAYGTAAREAIAGNEIIDKILSDRIEIRFPYDRTSEVRQALHPFRLEPVESEYSHDCRLVYEVRQAMSENVRAVCEKLNILPSQD